MLAVARDHHTAHTIGVLCVGGDWACAHGDLAGLHDVARQLATYVSEPLHCEVLALADLCQGDGDRAGALWATLRDRLYAHRAS